MEVKVTKKYVSLKKANTLIPKVREIMTSLIKLNNVIKMAESVELEFEDEFEFMINDVRTNMQLNKLSYEYYKKLAQLVELGCFPKDIEQGLLDFYSQHDEREIFLCWQIGEEKIMHWHETDEGYDERKPIAILFNDIKKRR